MPSLWVPPTVSRELQQKTMEHRAELMAAARRDATLDYWDRELQKLDPKLFMIKAADDAQVPGVKPGYYHVIRDCSPAPPAILPIVGDEGEFVEPTSRLLDVLRAGDLQNERAMEARRKQDEESARRRLRDKQRGHEERVEEMMDRWRSVNQTSVSMNRDAAWTQSANGKRAKKTA